MAFDIATAVLLIKQRLNRLPDDMLLDDQLKVRALSVLCEYNAMGIRLRDDDAADLLLLVDTAVWQYQNRDKAGGMPDWLRLRRRERWLQERG